MFGFVQIHRLLMKCGKIEWLWQIVYIRVLCVGLAIQIATTNQKIFLQWCVSNLGVNRTKFQVWVIQSVIKLRL